MNCAMKLLAVCVVSAAIVGCAGKGEPTTLLMRHTNAVIHATFRGKLELKMSSRVVDHYQFSWDASKLTHRPAPVQHQTIRISWELAGPTRHGDVYVMAVARTNDLPNPDVRSLIYRGGKLVVFDTEDALVYIDEE